MEYKQKQMDLNIYQVNNVTTLGRGGADGLITLEHSILTM